MAELIDFNFDQHKLNPHLSNEEILEWAEQYPEFKLPPGAHIPLPNAIRYISLMYDLNTRMGEQYPDVRIRKRECALMCGFKLDENGMFHETVEDMLIGENPNINAMIVRYIRLFDNPYYLTYVTSWNLLYTEITNSLEPQDSSTISKINENILKLNRQIREMSDIIFKGDDLKALKKALYKNMEREKLGLRPEEMATTITKGNFKPQEDLFGYPK